MTLHVGLALLPQGKMVMMRQVFLQEAFLLLEISKQLLSSPSPPVGNAALTSGDIVFNALRRD